MEHNRFTCVWFTLATAMLLLCFRTAVGAVVPGHVEVWGANFAGEAKPPPDLDGVIAVAGGSLHSLALRTNGTVVAWGSNERGESAVPAGLSNVVAIAGGVYSSAAVKADGTVMVWGYNSPQMTNVPPEAVGVTSVAIVGSAVVTLRSDGTVVAWGVGGETNVPPGLSNVVQISGVGGHVLALTRSGAIVGWGGNSSGEATPPPGLTNVVKVGAGQSVSMALKADGTLFRWGAPFALPGDPPGLPDVTDFDLGNQHALALRADGTVAAWGQNSSGQSSAPPLLNGVTAISAGGNHNLVVTARPIINSLTPPVSATAGANVTLTVAVSGEPLRYQWQHNGTNLAAETNASLTIRNIDASRVGNYAVYVSNPHGYNYGATLVTFSPPGTIQPESRTVYRGEMVFLSVTGSGVALFAYQWFRDDAPMVNETNATVVVPSFSREDSSTYHVTTTDSAGNTVTSRNATVTIIDPRPASITLHPVLDTSIHSSGTNPRGTSTILSGTRRNGMRDRGLLRFDLSSIPLNAIIGEASVHLQLFRDPGTPVASTFYLHRLLKPWGAEATWTNASSTVTWSAPGAEAGMDYTTNGIPAVFLFEREFVFGSTNKLLEDLSAWIQNPGTNHGWILISDGEAIPSTARHFDSSESGNPPQLIVSYSVPAEAPSIMRTRRESTNVVFEVNGGAGWFYNIQGRKELDRGVWGPFTNAPAGTGLAPIVISVPMTNSHHFFRAVRY